MRTSYRNSVIRLYFFMALPAMYWLLCVLSRILDLASAFKPFAYQSALYYKLYIWSYPLAGLFPEAVVGIMVLAAFVVVLSLLKNDRRARKWLAWGIAVTALAYLVIITPHMLGLALSTPGRPVFG